MLLITNYYMERALKKLNYYVVRCAGSRYLVTLEIYSDFSLIRISGKRTLLRRKKNFWGLGFL